MRVLLLEREGATREWLQGIIRARGHAVTPCGDVHDAWEAFQSTLHPLVILDWVPRAGPSLCRRIRGSSEGWRPVVLASGLSDHPAELEAALRSGADDYLPKPADAGSLKARLAVAEGQVRQRDGRARADETLRQLRKAVDTLPVGVSITDSYGRIVYVNPAEAEMHGYRVEELTGRDARILSPREHWNAMSSEELREVKPWRRERLGLRKDETTFPVQLLSDVVVDAEGRPIGLVTVCEDISDRQRAESALRESEVLFRNLVENARDVVAALSAEGTIASLNPAFESLTGWPPEEWIGRPFGLLVHPDDRSAAQQTLERTLKGRVPEVAELRLLSRSGQVREVECTTAPQIHEGRVVGALGLARDVTERNRARGREATRLAVSRVLNESAALGQAAPRLLEVIVGGVRWDLGLVWEVDGAEVRCLSTFPAFAGAARPESAALPGRGRPGEGLVESVIADGRPLWTADAQADERFRQAEVELPPDQRTVLLYPVRGGGSAGEVVAVIELRARAPRDVDLPLLVLLSDIAHQIGDFVGRRRTERALRESEERYALAVRGADDGLWDWDLGTDEIYVSSRWKAMLGLEEDEIGREASEWVGRIHPDDVERVKAKVAAHLAGRTAHFEDEHRMRHKDGSYRWVRCRGFAGRDQEGRPRRMAGALTDITDRRTYDPLTELPSRALFVERLGQAMARGRRRPDALYAVLLLDLDRFKWTNDSLGHLAGDELLVAIARRLETCLRPGDVVSRFGGDEFAILLESMGDASDAARIALRAQNELQSAFTIQGREVFASASIGIALSTSGHDAPEAILRDADAAMRRAKASGKGRFEVLDETLRGHLLARVELEGELRRALEREELRLHYQPVYLLAERRLVGFEALLRWHHPRRGVVEPAEFLPLAESTGLILSLGRWVVHEACRQLRSWRDRAAGAPEASISVNVSGRQLGDPDLPGTVRAALEAYHLDPASLRIEIAEGALADAVPGAGPALSELKSLGVALDIDDFGAGASSLSALGQLRPETLKIDRRFLGAAVGGGEVSGVMRAILALAHELKAGVAAKGVETEDQARGLLALGFRLGQGYYFSPPLDGESAGALVAGFSGFAEDPWPKSASGALAVPLPSPALGRAL